MSEEARGPEDKRPRRRPAHVEAAGDGGRVVEFSAPPKRERIAVTGGCGPLGSRFVKALAREGTHDIVVLDLAPAHDAPPEVRHRFIDLNLPYADLAMLKILREEQPDVIVHLAAVRSPSHDATYAHELNSLGSLHVLAAAGEAGVPRIIMGGTTMVYGARGDNPNYLTEDHRLHPDPQDGFVRDFVEAEHNARTHQKRYPDSKVVILRFSPFMSAEVRDYRAKVFEGNFAISLLGYDPVMQVLHPDDGVSAILASVRTPSARGVFNVAPDGVLPLSSIYMLFGTLPVPIPHVFAYAVLETAWLTGVGLMPGVHAHYLRYLCVASNDKAREQLGWTPRKTTLDVVLETARARRGRGRAIDFAKVEEVARLTRYKLEALRRRSHPTPAPRDSGHVADFRRAAS